MPGYEPVRLVAPVRVGLSAAARQAWPREAAGFLIGTGPSEGYGWTVRDALPGRNDTPDDPRSAFCLDPKQIRQIEREHTGVGRRLIGFFHSHPYGPGGPSALDLSQAWPGYLYLVSSPTREGGWEFVPYGWGTSWRELTSPIGSGSP